MSVEICKCTLRSRSNMVCAETWNVTLGHHMFVQLNVSLPLCGFFSLQVCSVGFSISSVRCSIFLLYAWLGYWMSTLAIPLDSFFGSLRRQQICIYRVFCSYAQKKLVTENSHFRYMYIQCTLYTVHTMPITNSEEWTVNALIIHNTKLLILIVPSTHISIFYCKIFIFGVRARVCNIYCDASGHAFHFNDFFFDSICHFPFSLLCAVAWRQSEILIFATSHFTCSLAASHCARPKRHTMCVCVYMRYFIHLTFSQQKKMYSNIYHLMCVRQVVNPSKSRQDTAPSQRIKKRNERKNEKKEE